tara:strand:+ start:580 stop:807 length:228 start_codon:yes stop_codon:yes gene_type:complete
MTKEQELKIYIQDFIETYNAIVEEINDQLDGIRMEDETNLSYEKEINCMKKARIEVIQSDEDLMESYFEIKRLQK